MKKYFRRLALLAIFCRLLSCCVFAEIDYDNVGRLLTEDKFDDAENILTAELAHNDKDPAVLSLLGELYRRKGDRKKAIKFLDRAVSADPKYPEAYYYRGKTLYALQRFNEATEDFNLFVKNVPASLTDDLEKNFFLNKLSDITHIYFSLKKFEEAKNVIDAMLRIDPKDQVSLYNLGMYYYSYERNRPAAYKNFNRAIEVNPNTRTAANARYAIEFMRANPDPRMEPDFDFIDQEYRN